MGAAASSFDGSQPLTDDERSKMSKAMQEKYVSLKASGSADDIEIFKELSSQYTLETNGDRRGSVPVTIANDEIIASPNNAESQLVDQSENKEICSLTNGDVSVSEVAVNSRGNIEGDDEIVGKAVIITEDNDLDEFEETKDFSTRRTSFGIDTSFSAENALMKWQTSHELISSVMEHAAQENEKITSFISQMKSGDNITTSGSEFRMRRLTYAHKVTHHDVPSPDIAQKRTSMRKRTTIFASSEIGVRQEKTPPFNPDIMGTFSCHGIEPDDIEGEIHQKTNQDRGCIVYPFNSSISQALFLVLDGHGEQGDSVSEFVMRQIIISLEKNAHLAADPVSALKEVFVKTNTALMVTPINYMTSGSTCVAVYMVKKHLFVANAGDSRAVLARETDGVLIAKNLTRDHKPDDPDEMLRITQWGGYVCPAPEPGMTARVYLDPEFTMIGLAMSRSLGDYAVKAVGVIAEPEVLEYDIEPNDKFMILASDGVWEFITNQEAVDIVGALLATGMSALDACRELIQTASLRWQEEEGDYRDDITAIVLKLPLPFHSS